MKTLQLLRHAKSDWSTAGQPDRERGLNARGLRDAPRMGRALARRLAPQPLLVSPARRAQLTVDGLCQGWPAMAVIEHRTVEALYTFAVADLLRWLASQPDQESSLFLVGHNPAFTDLVNALAPAARLANLPTAGYVRLRLPLASWSEAGTVAGDLELALFPRDLVAGVDY